MIRQIRNAQYDLLHTMMYLVKYIYTVHLYCTLKLFTIQHDYTKPSHYRHHQPAVLGGLILLYFSNADPLTLARCRRGWTLVCIFFK